MRLLNDILVLIPENVHSDKTGGKALRMCKAIKKHGQVAEIKFREAVFIQGGAAFIISFKDKYFVVNSSFCKCSHSKKRLCVMFAEYTIGISHRQNFFHD